ncbi:MAG: hypothetical protein QXV17_15140 [Candidatus Micrarchaeaceae archaeon]
MGKGVLIFIAGFVLGVVFIYSIVRLGYVDLSSANPLHVVSQGPVSTQNVSRGQMSTQNSCISQLNSALTILMDKLPTGAQSTIINTSNFGIVNTNNSYSAVLSWGNIWYSDPLMPGFTCSGDPEFYTPSYFCEDLKLAYNQSMNVEGVAVKIETPTITTTFPFLCGNGNLLGNATSFIEHGA